MKTEKPEARAVFPVKLLAGALVLTAIMLVTMAWSGFDSYRSIATVQFRNLRIEELRGTIVHLDEVLTMSARMAAATGDSAWERRYREFEPQLDTAIKEAMARTAHSDSAEAAVQTDAANLALVEMENQGFALVRAGDAARAKAILFSDAYSAQKAIYAGGMATLLRHLKEQMSANQRQKQREALFAIIAVAACIVLLLFTWLSVLCSLNSWRTTQSASLAALTRAEEALRRLNEDLEKRVEDRTRSLQLEIQERKEAEAALQQAQKIAHVGSWERDVIRRTVVWSHEQYRLFGLASGDYTPDYNSIYSLVHPDDRTAFINRNDAVLVTKQPVEMDFRVVLPGGEVRMLHSRADVVLDDAGNVLRLVGTSQDITARKLSEAELEKAHRELLEASRQAGMAEVATGILHNVGNVLNSVTVASSLVADGLRRSKSANLSKVVTLLREHEGDLGAFLTGDPKGRQLPGYLAQLAEHLAGEQAAGLKELAQLQKNIEHIKDIVMMQQGLAKSSSMTEAVNVTELVEDALRMNLSGLLRHDIRVTREFKDMPPVTLEKHKVLQILVNLVTNAKHACEALDPSARRLTIRTTAGQDRVRIAVCDNGIGIPPENLTRIFAHGFTTKRNGHGFGLHSAALAAKEMGGSLEVHSGGAGQGATFTLELPGTPDENPK